MTFRKNPEEKEQKQRNMDKLETKYNFFLVDRIEKKKEFLLSKYPEIKTLFQGKLYGIYVAILDHMQPAEGNGKLYYLFENTPGFEGKYKLTYEIIDNNCVFDTAKLKNFPKPYLSILKRQHFDLKTEKFAVNKLIVAHTFKLDEECYIHYADYNRLNNNIKNLVPLEKSFFEGLSPEKQKELVKPQQYIPEKYKPEQKKKSVDVNKMEYRACDLYFNHNLPVEKIAATLRNRLNKNDVLRAVKLYPYFKKYQKMTESPE